MYLNYADCRKRFGSPYQIDKAITDGRIRKIEPGIYSDGGRVSELEAIQFKYPKGILSFESAYFYHDLTDAIPDAYHLATPSNAPEIKDPRIRQHYVPAQIHAIGITEISYCGDRVRTYDLERLLIDTARMKSKLPSDLYKEVVLAFRSRTGTMSEEKIGAYLQLFPKRNMIERILYEEVF
jgi:predicted transcriptional regulator of viral defense system